MILRMTIFISTHDFMRCTNKRETDPINGAIQESICGNMVKM